MGLENECFFSFEFKVISHNYIVCMGTYFIRKYKNTPSREYSSNSHNTSLFDQAYSLHGLLASLIKGPKVGYLNTLYPSKCLDMFNVFSKD